MSTRVFLARHGQTVLNAQDRLRGLADPELDNTGRAQAQALADLLSGEDIAVVLSSPLKRAVATAAAIAKRLGVPADVDARFNDRDYGPWTGHERSEVVARFGSVDAAPGVEPTEDVLARVLPALDAVRREGRGIVIVSHDAVITPLVARLDPDAAGPIPTGSLSEIQWDGARWQLCVVRRVPASSEASVPPAPSRRERGYAS